MQAAQKAFGLGQIAEAEGLCRQLLSANPKNADAMLLLSDIAGRTGRSSLGQQLLRSAITYEPKNVPALLKLARLLRTVRGQEEAISLCRTAVSLEPENAEAFFVLGICCIDRWSIPEAIEALERAIEIRPDYGPAYDRLGFALQLRGRDEDSIAAYRRAVELMPHMPNSHIALGHILDRTGAKQEGEASFKRADHVASKSVEQMVAMARTYQSVGIADRAEAALRKAIGLAPTAVGPRILLSQALQESGKFDEAAELLNSTLKLHPDNSSVYYELVHSGKVSKNESSLIDAMNRMLKRSSTSPEDRVQYHYSLGKAYDDLGEFGNAITHFRDANRIARQLSPVTAQDRRAHSALVDSMIAAFTPEFFEKYSHLGSDSDEPVFIVGMPRSGTTLLEQILSSHPQIGAVGELTYLSGRALNLVDPKKPPEAENVKELADGYLRRIRANSNGEPRVTDKMPNNYMMAGIIHLLFPNARIINCRRNPIDTCLSIFVTPITVDFSHSLPDLIFSQREYERVMTHWRTVLPANRFMEVDYEDLVSNPEPIERKIIDFLGLPWNDAVLDYTGNRRAINTASRWQVRQPLHTGSVERWRRYEPWISDLLEEFRDLTSASDRAQLR